MPDIFQKKLNSIISISPTEENEGVLRSLSHSFINDIGLSGKNTGEERSLILKCYEHLEALERNVILSSKADRFSFSNIDISETVKNCVLACDTLLSNSDCVLTYKEGAPFNCVCSQRLILKAVTLLTCFFASCDSGSFIEFSLKKLSHSVVLSAEWESNNQPSFPFCTDEVRVLSKIARLHRGVCLYSFSSGVQKITLSLSSSLSPTAEDSKSPSYIELLLDKTSQVYIGLSKIGKIHFS